MVKDRIFRCGESDFYGDEILDAPKTHTSQRLKAISEAGFTGIWLRGRLRELVPGTLFRDFVNDVPQRLKSLRQLCDRSAKYNLDVWLFFTEPLGLPCDSPFWKANPHLRGHKTKVLDEDPEYSLCSSTPEVQKYLYEGFKTLFTVAKPAGTILITSSEQVNNCWAHVLSEPAYYPCPEKFWADACHCHRCSPRTPAEVISEVVNLVQQGVKDAKNPGKIVAWDWSWNMHYKPPYKQIINKMNSDVILMGDFERGLKVNRLGKQRLMEEYSLACPGPSPRFKSKVNAYANKQKIFAKLQINTTHELATVPNLPLIVSLYRKFKYMNENGIAGTMATWNFACDTDTLNVYAVNKLAKIKKFDNEEKVLTKLARDYFAADNNSAMKIVQCWHDFQKASQNYPVNGYIFLYWSPVNYALAYPLKEKMENKPMGPAWIEHEWGDRLEDTLGDYSLKDMVTLLGRLSRSWQNAAEKYEAILKNCPDSEKTKKETASAVVAGCSFRSAWNIYRWYQTKKTDKVNQTEIIKDEIQNLQKALPHIKQDKRLGFHQEPQIYMFNQKMVEQKLNELLSSRKL